MEHEYQVDVDLPDIEDLVEPPKNCANCANARDACSALHGDILMKVLAAMCAVGCPWGPLGKKCNALSGTVDEAAAVERMEESLKDPTVRLECRAWRG